MLLFSFSASVVLFLRAENIPPIVRQNQQEQCIKKPASDPKNTYLEAFGHTLGIQPKKTLIKSMAERGGFEPHSFASK